MAPARRSRPFSAVAALLAAMLVLSALPAPAHAQRPTLRWGSRGDSVRLVQSRLRQWGYYQGPVDGVYGAATYRAVILFQRRNGLAPDGVVGPRTYAALGIPAAAPAPTPAASPAVAVPRGGYRGDEVNLLARVVAGEARGEPYEGKVAVAAVILNRVRSPLFPNTLAGVIYQPLAFESVSNGEIWRPFPADSQRAAQQAMNGWDPTYGALYFWNPSKPVNPWVWTRQIIRRIGNHVFAR